MKRNMKKILISSWQRIKRLMFCDALEPNRVCEVSISTCLKCSRFSSGVSRRHEQGDITQIARKSESEVVDVDLDGWSNKVPLRTQGFTSLTNPRVNKHVQTNSL